MGFLLVIGIILLVFWILGLTIFNLGNLIYIALVLAVIFVIIWLVKAISRRH